MKEGKRDVENRDRKMKTKHASRKKVLFLYTTEMFRNMYKRNKKKRGVHAHVYILRCIQTHYICCEGGGGSYKACVIE